VFLVGTSIIFHVQNLSCARVLFPQHR